MDKIAVLDSGGQYCHLIARKVRELGVYAEILPLDVAPAELEGYRGVIISGGPSSVFEPSSPHPKAGLFAIPQPILGICYGHHLMAHHLDGKVEPGKTHEFGRADLDVRLPDSLFSGLARRQRVWMSHGDSVSKLPSGFQVLAGTRECDVAAMGDLDRKLFGLQFHPEVMHTAHGSEMLRNFLARVCGCGMDWHPENRVAQLVESIRKTTRQRRVLFFLSGGVDSTVAYALTVRALGRDLVHGIYVDTGFMRAGETEEIQTAFERLDLGKLEVVSAARQFFSELSGVVEPEEKRRIIGRLFVEVQDRILEQNEFAGHDWMLGQGTIYPDTIESGGTSNAAVIKTHHNRVERINELIREGRVLEPLAEFYKDEVRALGRALGLPKPLVERHPFPGPALAIRCLCAAKAARPHADEEIDAAARKAGLQAFLLPVRSVGVQGDSRSYAELTVLHGGPLEYNKLLPVATRITNQYRRTNRVTVALAPKRWRPAEWKTHRATLTRKRVALLQAADRVVTAFLRGNGLYSKVWQCPVVLVPLGRNGGETIVLRPITSVDGMTAQVAKLPPAKVEALAKKIKALPGVDAVLYDVSHKPPSTIEWE
ncbi:MAG: glutamine-hydrolyzing GMP synthase [Bryobacterales bacterium]